MFSRRSSAGRLFHTQLVRKRQNCPVTLADFRCLIKWPHRTPGVLKPWPNETPGSWPNDHISDQDVFDSWPSLTRGLVFVWVTLRSLPDPRGSLTHEPIRFGVLDPVTLPGPGVFHTWPIRFGIFGPWPYPTRGLLTNWPQRDWVSL